MIELTTGVMFLMSSLYGAGQANAQIANVGQAIQGNTTGTTTVVASITESKDIENYIRKEYADEPILVEVAWCESRYRQFDNNGIVIRGIVNSQDVGIMQINEHFHADKAKELGIDIYTVEGNVAFGKYLYTKYGTDPWKSSKKCWGSADLALKK